MFVGNENRNSTCRLPKAENLVPVEYCIIVNFLLHFLIVLHMSVDSHTIYSASLWEESISRSYWYHAEPCDLLWPAE